MIAYALRRIALMLPTLFAIMVVNFFIVQAAPGGPVEQMIAKIKGTEVAATARVTGGGGELKEPSAAASGAGGGAGYRGARGL
ncbi:MAG: microcin ABC transporter permease, partial [Thiohalocapsa sp.]